VKGKWFNKKSRINYFSKFSLQNLKFNFPFDVIPFETSELLNIQDEMQIAIFYHSKRET
jgi:hypothetical protein